MTEEPEIMPRKQNGAYDATENSANWDEATGRLATGGLDGVGKRRAGSCASRAGIMAAGR